jgi:acyl carrier protein
MTQDDLKQMMVKALLDIAPETDAASLSADVDLRDQLDIDSMDMLNFVTAIHEATGIDIPEADYPKLFTLDGGVAYLMTRAG